MKMILITGVTGYQSGAVAQVLQSSGPSLVSHFEGLYRPS